MAATRVGTSTLAGSGGFIRGAQGAVLASATSITVTDFVHEVSGAAAISTINAPSGSSNAIFVLIPAAGATWTLATGGNISEAVAAVTAGRPVYLHYDGTTFRPIAAGGGTVPIASGDAVLKDGTVALTANWAAGNFDINARNQRDMVNVKRAGAVGDGAAINGSTTSGSATLTRSGSGFTSADVGKLITVLGAGAGHTTLVTTIASYTSGTTVTLSDAASKTVTAASVVYGTDDTAAIQAAIDAYDPGTLLYFPNGTYLVSNLTLTTAIHMAGNHRDLGIIRRIPGSTGPLIAPSAAAYSTSTLQKLYLYDLAFVGSDSPGDILRLGDVYDSSGQVSNGVESSLRRLRVERATKGLYYETGTISVTNGSPTVTGSAGTDWETAWNGMQIHITDSTGETGAYTISSVGGAGSITLTSNFTGTTTADASYRIYFTVYSAGTVTAQYGVTTITGSGTSWPTDGSWNNRYLDLTYTDGVVSRYRIASVDSATQITLKLVVSGVPSGSGAVAGLAYEVNDGGVGLMYRPSISYIEQVWVTRVQTAFHISGGTSLLGYGLEVSALHPLGIAFQLAGLSHKIFGIHYEEGLKGERTVFRFLNCQHASIYGVTLAIGTTTRQKMNVILAEASPTSGTGVQAAANNEVAGITYLASAGASATQYSTVIKDGTFETDARLRSYSQIPSNRAMVSTSSSYSVPDAKGITTVRFSGSTAGRTITLPTIIKAPPHRQLTLINDATVSVTIAQNGGESGSVLFGQTSFTLRPGRSIILECDDSEWWVVGAANEKEFTGEWADYTPVFTDPSAVGVTGGTVAARYKVNGKTATVAINADNLSVGGTTALIYISVPSDITIANESWTAGHCTHAAGTNVSMYVAADAGNNRFFVKRSDGGSWTASTANTDIKFTHTFEIT